MKSKIKIIIILLLGLGIIGTVTFLQVENKNLFKGQIFNNSEIIEQAGDSEEKGKLPDLTGTIQTEPITNPDDDVAVNVTIKNIGPGEIRSGDRFKYSIAINGVEAFINTDSFSAMAEGDSFSFTYPIPRSIYEYKDSGIITLTLDTENTIKEVNEDNNKNEAEYSY